MSLFPHQKLDWNLARLEKHLDERGDDVSARLELATALWSRAQFHDGGEPDFNRALTQARRVLQQDPSSVAAQVVAGASLLGLDRLEPAERHLEQAAKLDPERADLRYALGLWHQAARRMGDPAGDRHLAVREVEAACRLAPGAWEPHALLSTLLWERAQELGGPSAAPRMLERSMFHGVRALDLSPTPEEQGGLLYHLGITCMHTGRFTEANKLLSRLLDDERQRSRAQYYLGLVNYQMGKHKNAVLYLRQHLQSGGESARVHARLGMAYLQLGEVGKARESCNRALAIDPNDLQARWTLGCTMVEEGREDEALKAFRAILEDAPDHAPAFTELVRLRARRGERAWLQAALRAEVSVFDRLRETAPRRATRERIATLVRALGDAAGTDAAPDLLGVLDLTTDESLRFQLWEAALDLVAARRAHAMARRLGAPGRAYSAAAGREILALARQLPENLLVAGLQIGEEDLRRAAVDRHGPARDVGGHREALDQERREARAWQALLLLAIASHGNRSSRSLLVRWAAEADADLADAARAALVMLGDEEAAALLRKRARARGAQNLVDAMIAQVNAPRVRVPVHPAGDGERHTCATCGRRSDEVAHMMVGGEHAICNHCLTEIALRRRELVTDGPEQVCLLSGRGTPETAAMYLYRGVALCREVVDHGLGLLEREAVDRWLAAQ